MDALPEVPGRPIKQQAFEEPNQMDNNKIEGW